MRLIPIFALLLSVACERSEPVSLQDRATSKSVQIPPDATWPALSQELRAGAKKGVEILTVKTVLLFIYHAARWSTLMGWQELHSSPG